MTAREDRILALLTEQFQPTRLRLVDDSGRHAGHAGARPGGETHYNLLVVAEAFAGLSRVERARRVHEMLAAEFQGGLHALSLTLRTPAEQARHDHLAP